MEATKIKTDNNIILNLGCGRVVHPDCINVDVIAFDPQIISHDLNRPFPFSSDYADAVYHSHILEHFNPSDAARFLSECHRCLKPRGIVRVVVPDLESSVRLYLQKLEAALDGDPEAELDYDLLMLELYDQCVRSASGGALQEFYSAIRGYETPFIRERLEPEALGQAEPAKPSLRGRRPALLVRSAARRGRNALLQSAAAMLGGRKMVEAVRHALFWQSGEVHKWMYDRFSLGRLLRRTGFREIEVCDAFSSRIPGFGNLNLDTWDGRVRKPDSLFIEARK